MRSILIHLRNATEKDIAAFLQQACSSSQARPWLVGRAGSPVLYIDFYHDIDKEYEAEDLLDLTACLQGKPRASVIVDVSGSVPGNKEVREFVCSILGAFEGIAHDEYTNHCWTREEVLNNERIQGHTFFDYEGWHRQ